MDNENELFTAGLNERKFGDFLMYPPCLREDSNKWSLSGDAGLLLYLKECSQKILTNTTEIERNVQSLHNLTLGCSAKIQNTFNDFLMLSNNQFIENRVYDDEEIFCEQTVKDTTKKEARSRKQHEEEVLKMYSLAVSFGIKVLDDFFMTAQIGEELNLECCDSAGSKQKDRYNDRLLPCIIGTSEFFHDNTLGLIHDEVIDISLGKSGGLYEKIAEDSTLSLGEKEDSNDNCLTPTKVNIKVEKSNEISNTIEQDDSDADELFVDVGNSSLFDDEYQDDDFLFDNTSGLKDPFFDESVKLKEDTEDSVSETRDIIEDGVRNLEPKLDKLFNQEIVYKEETKVNQLNPSNNGSDLFPRKDQHKANLSLFENLDDGLDDDDLFSDSRKSFKTNLKTEQEVDKKGSDDSDRDISNLFTDINDGDLKTIQRNDGFLSRTDRLDSDSLFKDFTSSNEEEVQFGDNDSLSFLKDNMNLSNEDHLISEKDLEHRNENNQKLVSASDKLMENSSYLDLFHDKTRKSSVSDITVGNSLDNDLFSKSQSKIGSSLFDIDNSSLDENSDIFNLFLDKKGNEPNGKALLSKSRHTSISKGNVIDSLFHDDEDSEIFSISTKNIEVISKNSDSNIISEMNDSYHEQIGYNSSVPGEEFIENSAKPSFIEGSDGSKLTSTDGISDVFSSSDQAEFLKSIVKNRVRGHTKRRPPSRRKVEIKSDDVEKATPTVASGQAAKESGHSLGNDSASNKVEGDSVSFNDEIFATNARADNVSSRDFKMESDIFEANEDIFGSSSLPFENEDSSKAIQERKTKNMKGFKSKKVQHISNNDGIFDIFDDPLQS